MNTIPSNDSRVSLLDLLVTIAENVKLLVAGSLTLGALALVAAFVLPPTYESTAIINPQLARGGSDEKDLRESKDTNAALIVGFAKSAPVIDAVRKKLALFTEMTQEQARTVISNAVQVSIGRSDKFVSITTSAKNAESAQKLTSTLLTEVFDQLKPKGIAGEQLIARLEKEKKLYSEAISLQNRLALKIEEGNSNDITNSSYASLVESNGKLFLSIQNLEIQVHGFASEHLIQPPSLPESPIGPKKSLIAIQVTVFTFIALLFFVLIRKSWQSADKDPLSAAKLAHIRQSLGFRKTDSR